MTKKEFKFIKGKMCAGEPADICFYTDVDYWSVDNFIWEFDYLVNYVCPSKIRIHINSAGGSCVEGMSVFSKIIDCSIPTVCINDALAASMGSIIWAAGDELYMKDYALLMIHNPFCGSDDNKEYNQVTEAFTQQLKTIYSKRFGLSDEEIQSIMDGKEGDDGTFMTAAQAVEKGFVKAENVIETPKAIKDKVQAALNGEKSVSKIKAVLSLVSSDFSVQNIEEQQINNSKSNKMDKNEITVFAALLGLTGEKATADNVTASINELKNKAGKSVQLQTELEGVKSQLTKAQAELAGANTSVNNLTADLKKANDALAEYRSAEEAARTAKVNALIDEAIANCKINKDERDTYVKMAQDNYDLAVSVLDKIPARDNLGNIISKSAKEDANQGVTTAEQEVQDKVNSVVGKDFKFRTLG